MSKSTIQEVELNEKKGTLTVVYRFDKKPPESKSGKTLLYVTTHGAVETDCEIDGKNLIISTNAYVYKKDKR